MNVTRSSKYGIKIDYDKSHDSYLYDKNSKRFILDFLSMYSSLPLGYNHPGLGEEFKEEILRTCHTKVTNCSVASDESIEFDKTFTEFAPNSFSNFYYCCTGSLAVEAALKTAIETFRWKKGRSITPKIITFKDSFHGINGWGSFATSRDGAVGERLRGWPSPYVWEADGLGEGCFHKEVEWMVERGDVAAVLVEPIRSTYGDKAFYKEFFSEVRETCTKGGVPLIFDEVQTGMGTTGTNWYYEQLGVKPDILIFGKKTQISGIMANNKFSHIFNQPYKKLEATWDATVVDMIRCKYIIRAYEEYKILENVREVGAYLKEELQSLATIRDVRGEGFMLAFDLPTEDDRDKFSQDAYNNGLLVNTAGKTTIRLRPNLNLSYNEADDALRIMKECL